MKSSPLRTSQHSSSRGIIYHYCSGESFVEILKSKEIRLTHCAGMNDSSESEWIRPYLVEALIELDGAISPHYADALLGAYDSSGFSEFIGSFSSAGDVLSQWRAYADDGAGFAIGYKRSEFEIHAPRQIPAKDGVPERTLGLLRVEYAPAEKVKKRIKSILTENYSRDHSNWSKPLYFLRNLARTHKNPAFKEEKEWRICYTPKFTDAGRTYPSWKVHGVLAELDFRYGKYGVAPYFRFPAGPESLAKIVLGPKNTSELRLIDLMLGSLGYSSNVHIGKSAVTYR